MKPSTNNTAVAGLIVSATRPPNSVAGNDREVTIGFLPEYGVEEELLELWNDERVLLSPVSIFMSQRHPLVKDQDLDTRKNILLHQIRSLVEDWDAANPDHPVQTITTHRIPDESGHRTDITVSI